MFSNRTTQKPDPTLISEFQSQFPGLAPPNGTLGYPDSQLPFHPGLIGFVPTPQFNHMRPVFHSPAGDLHTPVVEMDWGVNAFVPEPPVVPRAHSEPATDPRHDAPILDPPSLFQIPNLFPQQVLYQPPFSCSESDSSTGLEYSHAPSPEDTGSASLPAPTDSPFRYRVVLHTPTAIARPSDHTPVSYLNKSQAYTISVTDQAAPAAATFPAQYRTSISIAFDEPAHCADPAACWNLWRDRRGLHEARQRGTPPRAIEFVDLAPDLPLSTQRTLHQGQDPQNQRRPQLERASFNGFSVLWSSNGSSSTTTPAQCALVARFNFLSTDFSFSKGITGAAVRLYAKTELVSLVLPMPESESESGLLLNTPETCYCKVKVFRDHGAERRMSNDVLSVKKAMRKIEKQLSSGKQGARGVAPRRRKSRQGSATAQGVLDHLLGSNDRYTPVRDQHQGPGMATIPLEASLYKTLAELRDLFSSPRPVSVFAFGQEEEDTTPSPRSVPVHIPNHVACFYVRARTGAHIDPYYRALYLRQRTVADLVARLAETGQIRVEQIVCVVHVVRTGVNILVDDDVVREMREGQDIVAEFVLLQQGVEIRLFY